MVALRVRPPLARLPTFAGIVSLLNDLRLQAGKPTLGFLNPFIYQNAEAFNDVNRKLITSRYAFDNALHPAYCT